jgi:hypothetical protein
MVAAGETEGLHYLPSATECTSSYPCFYPFGYTIDTVIPADRRPPGCLLGSGWAYAIGPRLGCVYLGGNRGWLGAGHAARRWLYRAGTTGLNQEPRRKLSGGRNVQNGQMVEFCRRRYDVLRTGLFRLCHPVLPSAIEAARNRPLKPPSPSVPLPGWSQRDRPPAVMSWACPYMPLHTVIIFRLSDCRLSEPRISRAANVAKLPLITVRRPAVLSHQRSRSANGDTAYNGCSGALGLCSPRQSRRLITCRVRF